MSGKKLSRDGAIQLETHYEELSISSLQAEEVTVTSIK